LIFIAHVLPLASATDFEDGAGWLSPVGRRSDDAMNFCLGKVFTNVEKLDFYYVSRCDSVDEDRWTKALCNAFTARCERFDCDSVALSFGQIVTTT
jgi:hypothetical protein